MVLLLHSGRCYEAEICAILLPLRCSFRWHQFLTEVKIFIFWPKTMDYSPWFDCWSPKNVLRKMYLHKENLKGSRMVQVSGS